MVGLDHAGHDAAHAGSARSLRRLTWGVALVFLAAGLVAGRGLTFSCSSLATEHANQGTGLGLNIVRAIAQAHHGRLCFESAPGVGSTFRFEVPVASNRPGVPDTAPVVRSEPATDLQEH